MALEAGANLPHFDLPTDGGGRMTKADLAGRPFVLYLYPKDDTSGCTKEAHAFKELHPQFEAAGIPLMGLSRDPVATHVKFKAKHELPFPLLSDSEGSFIEALGAWVEKSMYGKTYMGIDRSTFLVDRQGRIARIWRKVKVPGHAREVLDAARELETAA